jgi:hypothetical protein
LNFISKWRVPAAWGKFKDKEKAKALNHREIPRENFTLRLLIARPALYSLWKDAITSSTIEPEHQKYDLIDCGYQKRAYLCHSRERVKKFS